ncbi:hypothetical protein M441DRAFT_61642 [Trichoderma asperellum CBS 433.97]|uniref:Uncharacterized protein n=1 Tax=Trichoderma asperellum (strain ATCC 204424 / CBS 433.97 / NBRC 101777) TaxID=1042311 RepID=A0A2T3YWJ1_TRIA4|nr:hypothetical protein M441DRAFT_61642 [Trichoderma asperellum CBS 433.97]PTB36923.1 hypothetical protein M441DRAFT_61642 [Trichoderma asperellum CBS 433.97]
MPLRCAKSLGHLLATGQVFAIPKAGTSFPPLSAALHEEQGLLFIPPSPFATEPAARSSMCSLWSTVSYHHRKRPCHAGTALSPDFRTEI